MPNPDLGNGRYEIAPYTNHLGLASDVISSCLLTLSVLSASVVIVALFKLDNKNKLRSRTLLGLFTAHLWSGAIFLGFILASLAGHAPRSGSSTCQVSAFLVESAMWCQYLFTVAVATVSYAILLHPLSPFTIKLERLWYLLYLTIYLVSLGISALQTGMYKAVYIGGFCFNKSESNWLNELSGCIPRAIVLFIIIALYWKITWFLRRHRTLSMTSTLFRRRKSNCLTGTTGLAIPAAPQVEELASAKGASPWDALYIPGLSEALMLSKAEEQTLEYRLPPFWFEARPSEKRPSLDIPLPSESTMPSSTKGPVHSAESDSSRTLAERASVPSPLSETSTIDSLDSSPQKASCNPYDAGPDYNRGNPNTNPKVLSLQSRRKNYETLHNLLMRKAALLFMLFPLTYAILTIISLARVIDDYAAPHQSPVMHAISRWTLFLQGPLDALTYGVIAFKIKKEVGKEIRSRWL